MEHFNILCSFQGLFSDTRWQFTKIIIETNFIELLEENRKIFICFG
jgi:hypothetical protein